MLKRLIEKALTKKLVILVETPRSGKRRKTAAKMETIEIPPSTKLVYGLYFIVIFISALTAIQITHLIVLGSFHNELFHLMNSLISITIGSIFGAKV